MHRKQLSNIRIIRLGVFPGSHRNHQILVGQVAIETKYISWPQFILNWIPDRHRKVKYITVVDENRNAFSSYWLGFAVTGNISSTYPAI